jgi:hypothetical protein
MPKLPQGDKGPCRIIYGYGESAALDLGDYFGQVNLAWETHVSNIEVEAMGDTPVDAIFTGMEASLEVPLTRPALDVLEAVLMGELITESGGNKYLKLKNPSGCSLKDLSKALVLKPLCNGVVDPDPANWVYIPYAVPIPAGALVFDRATQRTFPVKFLIFASDESPDIGEFAWLGMPSGSTEFGV